MIKRKKISRNVQIVLVFSLLLVLTGIIYYYNIKQETLNNSKGFAYDSWSINGDIVTYTGLNEQKPDDRSKHFITEDNSAGVKFQSGAENKGFFKLYLKHNNIPSTNFVESSEITAAVFEPSNVQFTLADDGKRYCDPAVGDSITELKALGFQWNTRCAWTGNYQESKLSEMAAKMTCKATDDTTTKTGTVTYNSGNGFVCTTTELLPATFNGRVEFTYTGTVTPTLECSATNPCSDGKTCIANTCQVVQNTSNPTNTTNQSTGGGGGYTGTTTTTTTTTTTNTTNTSASPSTAPEKEALLTPVTIGFGIISIIVIIGAIVFFTNGKLKKRITKVFK